MKMFRKPAIWVLFIAASIVGSIFSFQYFPKVFPITELDLKMNRESALEAAQVIATKHNIGPFEYKHSASFGNDDEIQYYIELEAGGSEAFQKLIREGLYSPYTWTVRHFEEDEVNECKIRFTPAGQPYGFSEWSSEDQSGASLSSAKAQKIAESEAKNSWNVPIEEYSLIEKSQETGNFHTNHIFTYERPDHQIGEARYRLRLEISGDKLTELYHYIKVPEEFSLRYQKMSSANNAISDVASFIFFSLYLFGLGCFGLFFLFRKRWVLWRAPLFWGIFVALLNALTVFNEFPAEWMYYNTALTTQLFVLEKIIEIITDFLRYGFIFTISFMAAESLTRKAFPGHIQLWRLSSRRVANSVQVLGRTVSGYLLVSLDFAFLIGLYFFSTKIFGWWTPSDVLFDPNVLATHFPWFSPVADSFTAGFWEECLCRAVPIAGAAIIGQKLGYRKLWIGGALIFQAILFGALHADYIGQPSYSRVVELIIPSLIYGWIYLRFGLLPCIILHFVYDAVLMALPLFVSSASGIWLDQTILVVLVFSPLWICIYRRLQDGKWRELGAKYYNKAWQPSEKRKPEFKTDNIPGYSQISPKMTRWVLLCGIFGLMIWIVTTNFKTDSPPLLIDSSQAKILAKKALKDHGIVLPSSWHTSSTVRIVKNQDDNFVWQRVGIDTYKKLLGNYLYPPLWGVRFANFEGDISARTEQYTVYITPDGSVDHISHELPENRAGASIDEDRAREIALTFLKSKYQIDPASLEEFSVNSFKYNSRQDWSFIFSVDDKNNPVWGVETHIGIDIAGDEVINTIRFVHVPEYWSRKMQSQETIVEIIENFCYYLVLILASIPVIMALVNLNKTQFSFRAFLFGIAILFGIEIISIINNWPIIWAGFSTVEPIKNQILSEFTSSLKEFILVPFAFALLFGFAQGARKTKKDIHLGKAILIGLASGIVIKSFYSLSSFLIPSLFPTWADYSSADSYFPILGELLSALKTFIKETLLLLLVIISIDRLSKGWTCRKILSITLMIIFWLALTAVSKDNIFLWLIRGLFAGSLLTIFYVFIFRFHFAIIPFTTATMLSLNLLQDSFYNAYPLAIPGIIVSIIFINLVSFYWYKQLSIDDKNREVFNVSQNTGVSGCNYVQGLGMHLRQKHIS
jgi:hypothetical protein